MVRVFFPFTYGGILKWWNCGGGGGCGYGDTTEVEYVHVEDGYADSFPQQPSPLRAASRARRTSALPPASAVSS